MPFPIALDRPSDVLSRGEHEGFAWLTMNNGYGSRCGYVRVPFGHPWYGKKTCDLDLKVHGGITLALPDEITEEDTSEGGWWLGFACCLSSDAPDPELPTKVKLPSSMGGTVRTQDFVEAECRSLCEQAKAAALSN